MKKIVFKSVVLAGVFALICSCSSEETTSTTPPVVAEDVVYNADVAPIISANCI